MCPCLCPSPSPVKAAQNPAHAVIVVRRMLVFNLCTHLYSTIGSNKLFFLSYCYYCCCIIIIIVVVVADDVVIICCFCQGVYKNDICNSAPSLYVILFLVTWPCRNQFSSLVWKKASEASKQVAASWFCLSEAASCPQPSSSLRILFWGNKRMRGKWGISYALPCLFAWACLFLCERKPAGKIISSESHEKRRLPDFPPDILHSST